MSERKIPTSLQFYKEHIDKRDFEGAHKFLIKQIGMLLGLGWKYEDVVKIRQLKQARDYVTDKFNKPKYPYLMRMVDFVYTRDLAYHSFGPWKEIEPVMLLAINSWAAGFIVGAFDKYQQLKLAGLLFAFMIREPVTKEVINENIQNLKERLSKSKGKSRDNIAFLLEMFQSNKNSDFLRIDNPDIFYFNSNLDRRIVFDYCENLKIPLGYNRYRSKNQNRVALWIVKPTQLLNDINSYLQNENNYFKPLIDKIDFSNLSYLGNITKARSFNTLKNNFERRYLNTNKKYFSNTPFKGFPFYRFDRNSEKKSIYIPFGLINYKLLLAGLFVNESPKFITEHLRIDKSSLTNTTSPLKKLKRQLIESALYQKYYPISSSKNPKVKGKHFEQIDKSIKPIKQITRNGISIDTNKLNILAKQLDGYSTYSNKGLMLLSRTDPDERIVSKINHWSKEVKEILFRSNTIANNPRIFGTFTTHATNTHRMNCSRYNLQQVAKEIKKNIFTAPKGWKLLSADVSGQDIAVAANLAQKIFNDPIFESGHNPEKLEKLRREINTTISKLSNANSPESKPIDNITNRIINEHPDLPPKKRSNY